MIMAALRGGVQGAASTPHHHTTSSSSSSSPAKRTFDVAFLTGAHDDASDLLTSSSPAAKVSRVTSLKVSAASASGNRSPLSTLSHGSTNGGSRTWSPASTHGGSGDRSPLHNLTHGLAARSPLSNSNAHGGSSPSPPAATREDSAPGSAFTKVTRSQGSSPPGFSAASTLDALSSAWPPTAASFSAVSSLLGGGKSLAPLLAPGFLPPGLAPFLPHAMPDRLNNNLVEEYLKSQHSLLESKHNSEMSASEALSRLRNSMYPMDPYKLPFSLAYPLTPPSPADKLGVGMPFLPQPSVSALMPPSFASLAHSAQNMCAKCNITFRMTSDLVYHMRSQHKREADPYKKRRNERLKCGFCGETFRERHHLTRHMSAHQDREEEIEAK